MYVCFVYVFKSEQIVNNFIKSQFDFQMSLKLIIIKRLRNKGNRKRYNQMQTNDLVIFNYGLSWNLDIYINYV